MFGFDPALAALLQVILIDVVLAGDNAVIIAMVANQVPASERSKVVWWGMAAAVALRIAMAVAAASILDIIGLMLAGGLLLLWVAWRLYRDLRGQGQGKVAEPADAETSLHNGYAFRRAIGRVVIADVSMSLDNVLAVAGAAMEHVWVLVTGLLLSIILMAMAAKLIAKLLHRYAWISYVGLVIIIFVACRMIWDGAWQIIDIVPTMR